MTNSIVQGNQNMEQICERYKRLYAALIFDVLEHMGHSYQAVSHELVPLAQGMKIAGPAFTVKGTTTCEKDESKRYKRLAMIKQMTHPCIEVRDAGTPFHVALYGELSATTAKAHGAVGALVDGGIRDSSHLIKMDFPVFARYRNPVEAFGRWMMLDYQVPVLVHGELTETVRVDPGDFIFGDLDGVMVVPKDLTLPVLEECERVMGIEDVARVEFARGDDPVAVFERHKRL
ncbi:RraA family protein [uncultured Paludibaculum sp.]|uniref:RraA family protein n=1 Tax=uncultured Paludibaculum sp. TaxID=1765020 RepID=UPI002AAAEDD6|nr:RraA family protein [uncultured Paludibaculum sp.]